MDANDLHVLIRAIGRLEGKVDGFMATMARQRQDHERLADQVRVLENWRWWVLGAAGALVLIIELVFQGVLT